MILIGNSFIIQDNDELPLEITYLAAGLCLFFGVFVFV